MKDQMDQTQIIFSLTKQLNRPNYYGISDNPEIVEPPVRNDFISCRLL